MTLEPGESVRALFLTLEGIEGSGKTTLANLLVDHFRARGREVVLTAEPGGCAVGERIRDLLLHSTEPISDKAELLLFEAARAQHVDTVIRPALERCAVVICDRFTDSSLAYQGHARGIDLDTVRSLNHYATSGLVPDLTILLDLPARKGLARQRKVDRISGETEDFHEAVRKGFLSIAQADAGRFVVIDAAQGIEQVLERALAAIGDR